jgi:hypothetical protein
MDSIRIKVRIFIVITVPIASEHEPKWQYDHTNKINKSRLSGFTDLFTNSEEMRDLWIFLLLNFE